MVDFSPSEFARVRLQFARDRDAPGRRRQPVVSCNTTEPRRARCPRVLTRLRLKNFMTTTSLRLLALARAAASLLARAGRTPPSSVLACEPEWGALAQELGGDKVNVSRRHHRAAGPAPHRGAAQPDRARAQRRPGGLHRRRARDRLAAAAAAAVGQRRRSQPGQPGYFEAADFVRKLEVPDAARPRRGRRARRRQPAHPDRPAQHRAASPPRSARAWRSSIRPTPRTTRQRQADFAQRWNAAMRAWAAQAAPLKGVAVVVAAQGLCLPGRLARPAGGRGARAQARRRAERVAPERGARARCKRAAGEDGRSAPAYQDAARRRVARRARAASRPSCCRSRSAARRRQGSVRPVRRHRRAPARGARRQ